MEVKIKKLSPDAVIPTYAKAGDAGMDLVATTTISSAVSTISFGSLPSGYSQFLVYGSIRVNGVSGGNDSYYTVRLSTNSGSSYISTSNYYNEAQSWDQPDAAFGNGAWNDSGFAFASSPSGNGGRGYIGGQYIFPQFSFIIFQPSTNVYPTYQFFNWAFTANNTDGVQYIGYGLCNATTSYINGFQITRTTGNKNIDYGVINVYGVKNA